MESGIELSQVDIEKIKRDKIRDEVGQRDEEISDDRRVMNDLVECVPKEELYERDDETRRRFYKGTTDILNVEDGKKEGKMSMEKYLREKGLSSGLIKSILTNGLTDEYIRLYVQSY